MIKLRFLLFCALAFALPAQAEMYKYVDEKGRVTYSNKPIKGGKKVDLPEISTMPAPKLPAPAAAKPAKSDTAERDTRRKELEEQIAKAEKALADAKQAYKEGEENPEVFRRTKTVPGKDGKPTTVTETRRNVAAFEEKMKRLQENVDLQQQTLDKLKAELAAMDAPPQSEGKK
jgi:chaperonin cofactor prefoldin